MSEREVSTLEVVGQAAEHLPAPIKVGLFKALNTLLGGLTSIPAAWIKRPAQAIDDTTSARSAVAALLAKGVADEALKDPLVM